MDNKKMCPNCNNQVNEETKFCPYCGCNFSGTRATALHQLQPYTVLNNRYQIVKAIGEGNFGITYLAQDSTLQMKVAIKEFYPKGYVARESTVSPQITIYEGSKSAHIAKWRENFITEARNLAKLSGYPGIVEVKDYFEANGTAYIVMEFLDGDDLETYIEKNGYTLPTDAQYGLKKRITVEQTKQIMTPVIQALAKVHEAGMVHRDISPDNIKFNAKGSLKVFDFGAAREIDPFGTAEKTIMLKLGYAPEEQHRKKGNQGPWTDVYALCATFYKCITGIVPIDSTERIYQDTLAKPSELGIQIDPYDEMALMTGLALYADKRFSDMNALYRAFYRTDSGDGFVSDTLQTGAQGASSRGTITETNRQEQGTKKSNVGLFIGIGAGVVVMLAAAIIFLVLNLDNLTGSGKSVAKRTEKEESTEVEESTVVEEEEDELLAELQGMMDSQQYEDLITEILDLDEDDLTDEQVEAIDNLLSGAIAAQLSASYTNIDSLAASGSYDAAFTALEEERIYRETLLENEKAAGYIDNQTIDEKYTAILQGYSQYVMNKADQCATQADEVGVEAIFAEADNRLSGEVYEKLKVKTYGTLIMKVATKMNTNGQSAEDIMSYIEQNQHKSDNNCWVLEFWDYFYALYRMQHNVAAWDTTVRNVSNSGFILDYSDEYEMTMDEISHLSRFELQLARFEIYARHGRSFNDPSVTTYFTQYSWYEPVYGPENFDESCLSDIERKNRDLILEYEEYMGYRNCR